MVPVPIELKNETVGGWFKDLPPPEDKPKPSSLDKKKDVKTDH